MTMRVRVPMAVRAVRVTVASDAAQCHCREASGAKQQSPEICGHSVLDVQECGLRYCIAPD